MMNSSKLGNADFVALLSQGHPEWSVFCVTAKDGIAVEDIATALGWSLKTDKLEIEVYEDLMEEIENSAPSIIDLAAEMIP